MTGLVIMDGFGLRDESSYNAIKAANTPNLDKLMKTCPHTKLGASGLSVGLPDGQMGNSEVGHLNIGGGRIVYQDFTRISKSISDGDFFTNPDLSEAMEHAVSTDRALHIMGLVSDGGVHSHITHLFALIDMAKQKGVKKLFIHCFMDGRDTPPTSGAGYIASVEEKLDKTGLGKIATVSGRFYAMDRDKRWDRVKKAYDAIVFSKGRHTASAGEAMNLSYSQDETDEFIIPTVVGDGEGHIRKGDSVIFMNFRPDRARELTSALTQKDFDGFEAEDLELTYVCMTTYNASFTGVGIAFRPQVHKNTLGEYLSTLGKTQFRIAETEKYAHVTFFFNGGVETPNPGEDRFLIPSPKVATYDLQPEMCAREVTDKAVELIDSGKYDVMILNFANCDMVGHTGVFEAAVKAVETVDECVGRIVEAVRRNGGDLLITADHGNADCMFDEQCGLPLTSHTTNPVPLILVSEKDLAFSGEGILADISPTMLFLMGIEKPSEMTGRSLLEPRS